MCRKAPEEEEAQQIHNKIERQIKEDSKKLEENVIKLLLLGPGESGKSTVLKQFRLIHGSDFTDAERRNFRVGMLSNVIACGKSLVGAMEKLQIQWETPNYQNIVDVINNSPPIYGIDEFIPAEVVNAIKKMWKDSGIQKCFLRSNEYQLIDSCKYIMEDIDRICKPDYTPTNNDILRLRVMTTTITENRFKVDSTTFRVFDVGGQRSERKKWAPYFDDCTAIIFVVAISSFDQTCAEDDTTNRITESLTLFGSICNHPLFVKTAMILFMNKIDIFTEKLKTVQVSKFFPEYKKENTFEPAGEFFANKFIERNKTIGKKLYINFTWATDTNQTKRVLATVSAIVLKLSLKGSGLY